MMRSVDGKKYARIRLHIAAAMASIVTVVSVRNLALNLISDAESRCHFPYWQDVTSTICTTCIFSWRICALVSQGELWNKVAKQDCLCARVMCLHWKRASGQLSVDACCYCCTVVLLYCCTVEMVYAKNHMEAVSLSYWQLNFWGTFVFLGGGRGGFFVCGGSTSLSLRIVDYVLLLAQWSTPNSSVFCSHTENCCIWTNHKTAQQASLHNSNE